MAVMDPHTQVRPLRPRPQSLEILSLLSVGWAPLQL